MSGAERAQAAPEDFRAAMAQKLVRFQNPERALGYTPPLGDAIQAALFGIDESRLSELRTQFDAQLTDAATELADDSDIRELLGRLPFVAGERVVALGESTTADRLSWFEILRRLLEIARPDLQLEFDNLAQTGSTTTQALGTVPALRRQPADWVFCMLGTNDAQRFGSDDAARLVSEPETLRNLQLLRTLSGHTNDSTWVWLSPPPIDESMTDAFGYFRQAGLLWRNRDIASLGAELMQRYSLVIDTEPAVSGVPNAHIEDGAHPSIDAHRAITALVVTQLAEEHPSRDSAF